MTYPRILNTMSFRDFPGEYNQESHKDTQVDFPCRWFHTSVARWDGAKYWISFETEQDGSKQTKKSVGMAIFEWLICG